MDKLPTKTEAAPGRSLEERPAGSLIVLHSCSDRIAAITIHGPDRNGRDEIWRPRSGGAARDQLV